MQGLPLAASPSQGGTLAAVPSQVLPPTAAPSQGAIPVLSPAPAPSQGLTPAPTPSQGVIPMLTLAPVPSLGVTLAPAPFQGTATAAAPSQGVTVAPAPSQGVTKAPAPSPGSTPTPAVPALTPGPSKVLFSAPCALSRSGPHSVTHSLVATLHLPATADGAIVECHSSSSYSVMQQKNTTDGEDKRKVICIPAPGCVLGTLACCGHTLTPTYRAGSSTMAINVCA